MSFGSNRRLGLAKSAPPPSVEALRSELFRAGKRTLVTETSVWNPPQVLGPFRYPFKQPWMGLGQMVAWAYTNDALLTARMSAEADPSSHGYYVQLVQLPSGDLTPMKVHPGQPGPTHILARSGSTSDNGVLWGRVIEALRGAQISARGARHGRSTREEIPASAWMDLGIYTSNRGRDRWYAGAGVLGEESRWELVIVPSSQVRSVWPPSDEQAGGGASVRDLMYGPREIEEAPATGATKSAVERVYLDLLNAGAIHTDMKRAEIARRILPRLANRVTADYVERLIPRKDKPLK